VGISEIEFLGSGAPDEDAPPQSPPDTQPAAAGPGGAPQSRDAPSPFAQIRALRIADLPGGRVTAVLAALLATAAAAAFAVVRQDRSAADAFDLSLISASYTLTQDASGIDLSLALRNTGSTLVELTAVGVTQPGLIRLARDSATAAPPPARDAIAPTTIPPGAVEQLTVPFRYDCASHATAPVARTVSLTGLSARGTARTEQLALPPAATPWDPGGFMRSTACGQPAPETELAVRYGGPGRNRMDVAPVRDVYTVVLTAPNAVPVTVENVDQDRQGIALDVDPALPAEVLDGQSVTLTVSWRVTDCAAAATAHPDGVEITAAVSRTAQTWHAPLGDQFAADLAARIRAVCPAG
jgi:hypothetical protein